MRKLFTTILLLLSAGAFAQQIGLEEAQQSAIEFMSSMKNGPEATKSKTRKSAPQLLLAYTAKLDNQALFYVFNDREGGFVVTSGDERAERILAYSDHGSFDMETANPNLKFWLKGYEKEISEAVKQNLPPSPKTDTQSDKADVPILIKCQWGQDMPFNKAIRTTTSKNYPTGCVATAMSQVMKYHEWPVSGTGSHTYYDSEGSKRNYTRNFEHTYDWGNMLNNYTAYTTEEADAVAELMFDVGASVNMQYTLSGSAAYTEQVSYAFINFFGYDEGVAHAYRDYYTNEEWEEIIYNELAAGRPIMYGGNSSAEGGHSFICDGYRSDVNKYHFNWGWEGDDDCYCSLKAIKSGNIVYDFYHDIVYGIQKPCGGKTKFNILIYDDYYLESVKEEKEGYTTYELSFGVSDIFNDKGFIWNDSPKGGDVIFNMKYVNQRTGKAYYATPKNAEDNKMHFEGLLVEENIWEEYHEYYSVKVKDLIIPDLPAGEYKVYLVYKEWEERDDDTKEWDVVRSYATKKNYVEETIESRLEVPIAQEAKDVTEDGFTASWTTVEGAEKYSLSLTSIKNEKISTLALEEDFSEFDSHENDGIIDIGNKLDIYLTDSGWTGEKVYSGAGCIKLGSTKMGGTIMTPTLTSNGKVIVTIDEAVFGTDVTEVTVEVGQTKATFTAEGKQHKIETEIDGEFNVVISTYGGKQRVYINQVKVEVELEEKSTIIIENIQGTEYTFSELDNAYSYAYKIQTQVGEEYSKWSNEVNVTLHETVPIGTCEAPIIAYEDGILHITSATEGAKCYYTLSDADVRQEFTEVESEIEMDAKYLINAYATKDRWKDSEMTTALICWIEKLPESGTDVIEVKSTPVIVQFENNGWAVRGLPDDIEVSVYSLGGILLGSAKSKNGIANIPSSGGDNEVVVIKIGDNAIKFHKK